MIRVFLADDAPAVREVLRAFLAAPPERFEVVGEAANGSEALDRILLLNPDIALLDICMPSLTGLEVVRQLRERGLETPVILCSGEPTLMEERPAGVVARLSKPIRADHLMEAINEALSVRTQARRA